MRRLAGRFALGAFGAISALAAAGAGFAQDYMGQPVPNGVGLQAGVTELRDDAQIFHDLILLPMCVGISLLVLGLLVWCIVRYNKKANPTPARWSHNTAIEVIWTVTPVVILLIIAVFSFNLLFKYHDMPKPDVTVKATGFQWYWGYEYPDQEVSQFVSNILPEDDAKTRGVPFRLAATEPMVVPVNKTVRVLVTAEDVIHAFGVPAFGIVIDAIPGRVNETWFKATKTGTFYGQCRELCGVDHAFMPIEVRVVTDAEFDAWVASKGGKTAAQLAADQAASAAQAAADAAATAAAPADVTADAANVTPGLDAPQATTPPATPAAGAPAAAPAAPAPAAKN